MSHVMRKPVLAIHEQQRCRSACASMQSDSAPLLFTTSIIPILAKSKISRLQFVSVAEQTSLSLIWSETPKTSFPMTRLIFGNIVEFWVDSNWSSNMQDLKQLCSPLKMCIFPKFTKVSLFLMLKWATSWENLSLGFATRQDSNWPAQPQRLARVLWFAYRNNRYYTI